MMSSRVTNSNVRTIFLSPSISMNPRAEVGHTMKKHSIFPRQFLFASFFVTFLFSGTALSAGDIVISQIYGGGGNSGATYKNDFIELFNRSSVAIDVTGWSMQYASASGASWQKTDLSGTIEPLHYYLIQEAAGPGGTVDLPVPDAVGTIAISANSGKVALVNNNITITTGTLCPGGSTIIDFIGFGSVNCYEGSGPAPALSDPTAGLRRGGGVTDTDDNAADISTGVPTPRNSAFPPLPVQLASFTVERILDNDVKLEWLTVSEVDNFGFHVQRQAEGQDAYGYVSGGFISGHGTTLIPQYYSYLDQNVASGIWSYRLKQVDRDGTAHFTEPVCITVGPGKGDIVPAQFGLGQNYPNPFNPSTEVRYQLPVVGHVRLVVYDLLGRALATLVNEVKSPGNYTVAFDASNLASGLYLYRLETGKFVDTKRMVVAK